MSRIFNMGLINEMQDYATKSKAEIVHNKCLKVGKFALANKIARKYGIVKKHDDCIMSFAFALQAITGNKLI